MDHYIQTFIIIRTVLISKLILLLCRIKYLQNRNEYSTCVHYVYVRMMYANHKNIGTDIT